MQIAPMFKQDAKRVSPYKNFKFQILWDGKVVAGVNKISALKMTTEVVKWRSGTDPASMHKSIGQTDWAPITLEQGLTHDMGFQDWAAKIWSYPNSAKLGGEVSLADFRKDITINLMNVAGQIVRTWVVYKCWPSEYTGMPDLDASANAVAIETMTLQCEGWELTNNKEPKPAQTSFSVPS